MNPRSMVREVARRDPVLAAAGGVMVAGLLVAAGLALFDTRLILGINPWIKPMKFLASIAIFFFTLAWFMPEADPRSARRVAIARRTVVTALFVEIVAICLQAARGTTSHYNVATLFDAIVFQIMGALIVANTIAIAVFARSLRRDTVSERAGYAWGIQLGLWLFVAGSVEGFVMTANMAHTVPAPDGGPGLPFVNWSTTAGDLRIAHFMALHALQVLPLAGYLLDRMGPTQPWRRAQGVTAVASGWTVVTAALLWQALSGQPLLPR